MNSKKRTVEITTTTTTTTILALQALFPELIKLTEGIFSKIVTEPLAPPEEWCVSVGGIPSDSIAEEGKC